MSIYDYKVPTKDGKETTLADYRDKVLLIVNTATQCGFTPELTDLEKIYEKYQAKGFELLDFPCNQFEGQAPESIEEIDRICTLKYGTTFPRFGKIEVNGDGELGLYTYLKSKQGFTGFEKQHKLTPVLEGLMAKRDPDYTENNNIKWNFTKFLVDRKGNVVARFEPSQDLSKVEEAIQKLL
ncbi:MAG: glutathione peroxidase [Sphaerochaeta sp.]|jgi:glutathione peroxidase|nr:glutathione peroxidase [Spirochaetales bacterium]